MTKPRHWRGFAFRCSRYLGGDAKNGRALYRGRLVVTLPGQRYDAATQLNYNYFRDYDSVSGRYAESDPVGLAGGISTYGYAAGKPLSSYDPLGLAVFLGYHEVLWLGGIGTSNNHLALLLVPDDQDWAKEKCDRCKLGGTGAGVAAGKYWTTISAGPSGYPGDLISTPNRANDGPGDNTLFARIYPLINDAQGQQCRLISDAELIERLLKLDAGYSNGYNYDYFPKPGTDGFNSNSFAIGILRAAGLVPPQLPQNTYPFPGASKPLPASAFGVKVPF